MPETAASCRPTPHSPNAHRIHDAFIFVAIFTGVIFLIVEGALILFIVKYRRGKRPRTAEGPQIHGSTRLEVLWTVVPVLILAAIGTFIFWELPGIADAPKAALPTRRRSRSRGTSSTGSSATRTAPSRSTGWSRPANEVVHENVIGLDFDVNHSWWVPDLGRKYDAIPGRVEQDVVPGAGRRLRRAVRRALRHPARAHGRRRPRRAARAVRQVHRDARRERRQAALGKEEWQGVCEKCHRLDHVVHRPALGGNPLLANRKGIESLLRNGEGNMPAVGKNWTDAQIDALIAYTKQFAKTGGGPLVAVNVEAARPYRADWRRGSVASWLTTVDHKRIGILYIWTSLVFFAHRRHPRAPHAHAARDAERARS